MLITLLYVYFIHRHNDWFVCHSDLKFINIIWKQIVFVDFARDLVKTKIHYETMKGFVNLILSLMKGDLKSCEGAWLNVMKKDERTNL